MATTVTKAGASGPKPLYKSLFFQVVVALVLGIVIGAVWPDFAQALKPLGDGFIKLIKMIIAPHRVLRRRARHRQAGDLKKVGRVGVKAIIYFEVVTTFALLIGVILAYVAPARRRHEHRSQHAGRRRDGGLCRPGRRGAGTARSISC